MDYYRHLSTLRKMQPGTLGGQSYAATPVSPSTLQQGMVVPRPSAPIYVPVCPRYLGDTTHFTWAVGLSEGGSVLTFLDHSDDPSAYVRVALHSADQDPVIPFGELSRHAIHPDFEVGNFAVDEEGWIYYWVGVVGGVRMARQRLDVIDVFSDLVTDTWFGPAYSPYDQMLYDGYLVGSDFYLRRIDPVTGDIFDTPLPGIDDFGDMVAFTPDGSIWMLVDLTGFGFGAVARYDLTTDEFDIMEHFEVADSSGTPVPLFGIPGAGEGDVLVVVEPDETFLRVQSGGAGTEDITCEPFLDPSGGTGTARVASGIFDGNWVTTFIWTTVFGNGFNIYMIGPVPLGEE